MVVRTATVDQGIPSAGTDSFLTHCSGLKSPHLSDPRLCITKKENLTAGALRKKTWLEAQNSTKVYGNKRVASFPSQNACLWNPSRGSLGKAQRTCPKAKSCMVLWVESALPPQASD